MCWTPGYSSALWTHSTVGWPQDTEDLRYFYPTSVMATGYDILFFWVARMIMMGLENTGDIPFHTVYLSGLIRDAKGVKMSKTRGNVIDPLKAIEQYGTDALRFALTTGNAPGNDLRLSPARLEASRNFANKLWNAARFVITTLKGSEDLNGWFTSPSRGHREDRWILSRLNRLIARVGELWQEFQLGEAQRQIHDFLWGEYCDWYIELAKIRLRAGDSSPQRVLAHVLERTLRLLHPFMPFITEEVWQNLLARLPREGQLPESIMIAPYPVADSQLLDDQAEEEMGLITEIIRAIRNARAEFRVEAQQWIEALVDTGDAAPVVEAEAPAIKLLARVEPLYLLDGSSQQIPSNSITLVLSKVAVTLPLGDVVDLAAERRRLEQELHGGQDNLQRLRDRLQDPMFLERAPEDVVEREQQRLSDLEDRIARIQQFSR